jgi:hypothetical protein
MWLDLTEEEKKEMRKWARDNYHPCDPINGTWYPVVQEECVQMNKEWALKFSAVNE